MYKYETHLHTSPVSRCARVGVEENLIFYKKMGYDGVFITNHFLDGNIDFDRSRSYEEGIEFYFSDYEKGVEIGDLYIKSFKTPHDSNESCGYTIMMPDGQKVAVATDIGHMTEEIMTNLKGSSLVMLESNHDEGMLRNGPYPYYLKRRILSDVGHLSNNACAEAVTELLKSGTVRFFLGHLSRDNNFPALAYETSASALKTIGAVEGRDFFIEVNKIENDSDVVRF